VSATFAPNTAGPQSTIIAVCDNAGSKQSILLTGNAVVPPPIHIEPDRFDFGQVIVGRRSSRQRFVVANPSPAPVNIGRPATEGAFILVSTDCGPTLPGNSGCAAEVLFAPTQPGAAAGTLYVPVSTTAAPARADSKAAPSGSAVSLLSGTGINVAQIEVASAIDFGAYTIGDAAIGRSVVMTNTGNAVVTLDGISVSGPFTLSHDCPFNFHPGTSCTLTLTFRSTTVGEATGTVTIRSSASGGTRFISLRGLAQRVALPVITFNPVEIGFGNRTIDTESITQRIVIANEGGADATLGPMIVSADYVVKNTTCGPVLAAQASCFTDVAMRPRGMGSVAGTLNFSSNAAGSVHEVKISGTGCRPYSVGMNRGASIPLCSP
jgi:hypothetical protein